MKYPHLLVVLELVFYDGFDQFIDGFSNEYVHWIDRIMGLVELSLRAL